MSKIKVFYKDISEVKEFNRIGYHYTLSEVFPESNIYVYRMEHIGSPLPYSQYEAVYPPRVKNPDGSYVRHYPGTEEFGVHGWYICGSEETCRKKIERLVLKYKNN